MLSTSMAYLGAYLCDVFGFAYDSKRVRMCSREHLLSEISGTTNKIELPAVSYAIEGVNAYMGGRTSRGTYTGSANITVTEAMGYVPFPIRVTIRLGIVCVKMEDSLEAIHKYFSILGASSFEGVFHHGRDSIEFENAISELEDLTTPPGLKETRDYEPQGLLYSLDGGFNLTTTLLYTKEMKLIRATRVDFAIYNLKGEEMSIDDRSSRITESVGIFEK